MAMVLSHSSFYAVSISKLLSYYSETYTFDTLSQLNNKFGFGLLVEFGIQFLFLFDTRRYRIFYVLQCIFSLFRPSMIGHEHLPQLPFHQLNYANFQNTNKGWNRKQYSLK